MQFKATIKGIWKVWYEPLFFEVLPVSYKVHYTHWAEKATRKNSRNVRKVSAFLLKKREFSRKIGLVVLIYNADF